MKKVISHPICAEAPGWPGNPSYYIERRSGIACGNSANSFMVHIFNHFGTHFDAPQHFNPAGISINELPFDTFFYDTPLLLDIPKQAGEKIDPEDLIPYEAELAACDLLMIRTGFESQRSANPAQYQQNGPAISARTAQYLRTHFTGTLKAVAMDFLSLAAPSDTADGDEAHRIMLGAYEPGYICIIEDVSMAELSQKNLASAAAVPLFFQGIDSCPVTMWVNTH